MKLNTDKFHLLLNSQETNTLKVGGLHINNSLSEKVLGITFGCKLKFNKHIQDICHKSITEVERTCKTCTLHENNKKKCSYKCIFQVTMYLFPISVDVLQ